MMSNESLRPEVGSHTKLEESRWRDDAGVAETIYVLAKTIQLSIYYIGILNYSARVPFNYRLHSLKIITDWV